MTRFLITPSLYAAWRWSLTADDDGEARQDLLTTLRREQVPPNERMLMGRKFEADVQSACEGVNEPFEDCKPAYQDCVLAVADVVRGGLWQERTYHNINFLNHGDFLLYGRADVIKGAWIYDIKFVKDYDIGKYKDSIQHLAYFAGSNMRRFGYLASNGTDWWREDYFRSDHDYERMRGCLSDMLDDFKRDPELGKLYAEHWVSYS